MKILHIETSSKNCSVAISEDRTLLSLCEEVSENYKQSESLHTFIQWALQGTHLHLKDLDAISLGKGPGSYTGLRIGAASAKGLCFSLDIPLIAVDSMYSMIEPFINTDYDYIIPVIDARRMEVYSAVFHGKTGEKLGETQAVILDENSFKSYTSKRVLFVGDGAQKASNILRLPHATFNEKVYPSAKFQLKKSAEQYMAGNFENIAYFEPFYLKDFHGIKNTPKSKIQSGD